MVYLPLWKNDGVQVSWNDKIPNWIESHHPNVPVTTNQTLPRRQPGCEKAPSHGAFVGKKNIGQLMGKISRLVLKVGYSKPQIPWIMNDILWFTSSNHTSTCWFSTSLTFQFPKKHSSTSRTLFRSNHPGYRYIVDAENYQMVCGYWYTTSGWWF